MLVLFAVIYVGSYVLVVVVATLSKLSNLIVCLI